MPQPAQAPIVTDLKPNDLSNQIFLRDLVQNKQAVLDFTCAHTQQGPEGFTLTLTIFGHAEKKECRTVSDMSVSELAALWSVSISALHNVSLTGFKVDSYCQDASSRSIP